jgi:hypothetical protein
MLRDEEPDWAIASFQEKLNFLFFGKLAMIGQEDASEFLTLVNAILSESAEADELCDPIILEAINDLSQEEEYQAQKGGRMPHSEIEEPEEFELPTTHSDMSKSEIRAAIDDALDSGDFAEVERLSKMLGEGFHFPRISFASLLLEKRK